jgi:hypothetical protein
MKLRSLQKLYIDFLKEEGYRPKLAENGAIWFKYEGRKYWLFFHEDDEEYFRIYFSIMYNFDSDEKKSRALKVVNTLNATYKVGKMCVDTDDYDSVSITTDLFLANEDDLKLFFWRCLNIIRTMFSEFEKGMKDVVEEADFLKLLESFLPEDKEEENKKK